eukprot:TRINITY_DN3638_c1_g1_i1.p1 TRINITY_DN3638_c1_g1~~TRINITY_DN3638_c1_g1_i1.p1  ORF type:complete len:335 (+),score=129.76 TRINITY_DN3638_c1_g1_i1:42-1046(+)
MTRLAILAAAAGCASAMRTFELAPGVEMPAVLLGTGYMPPDCDPKPACQNAWQNATGYAMTKAWLAAGGRGIDTAWMYNDQIGVAAAVAESGVSDEVFVLTKIPGVMNYSTAMNFLEQNVAQLGRPLDAVISHWCDANAQHPLPPGFACTEAHIWDTWRALEDFYRAGKARAIGVSNYCVRHMETLRKNFTIAPQLHQIERSPYYEQEAMTAYCKEHGIHIQGYAPLNDADRQSGSGPAAHALLKDPVVTAVAAGAGVTPGQALLLWQVQRGHSVTPRVGGLNRTTPNLQHIRENLAVVDGTAPLLSEDALRRLDAIADRPKTWPTAGLCHDTL